MGKKVTAYLMPLMGFLFLSAYIRSATVDVVYTDYIRLINSYLADELSLAPYMRADVLTRIPVNYIERLINVRLFAYSTTFDMMLGAAFLAAGTFMLCIYAYKAGLGYRYQLMLFIIMFSLNKWEMLTNGSGWVHFMAFAGFFMHFLAIDRGREKLINILPWLIILFIAGPYSASFAAVSLIAYTYLFAESRDIKKYIMRVFNLLIPFAMFVLSRMMSVEEHAGATKESIGSVISRMPFFLPELFIKSFASDIIGLETAKRLGLSDICLIIAGGVVILIYAYCIYLNISRSIYKKTLLPLILLGSGIINHLLVCMSRWIFLNSDYAMSSRYALQFQLGTAGAVLTLGICAGGLSGTGEKASGPGAKRAAALILLIIALGNLYTTHDEIELADERKQSFMNMREAAENYRQYDEEELGDILQYHKGGVRDALELIERRKLNVFRE